MSGQQEIDVWAEQAGIRVEVKPWHDGVTITIYDATGPRSMTANIAAYRWKQILDWLRP